MDDGNGLALSLGAALDESGLHTHIVSSGADVPTDTDGVIYLRSLRDYDSVDAASDVNFDAFVAARQVANRFTDQGGFFMAVQDTGGRFALDEWCEPTKAAAAGLAALAKTAAKEWPKATVRALDLDLGHRDVHSVAQELAEEILNGGEELEIGRPEGERIRLDLVAAEVGPADLPRLRKGDLVVVSGGARGVTADCIIELGRRTRARFALLGRSPLPDRDPLEDVDDDAALKRALLQRAKDAGESLTPRDLQGRAQRIKSAREIRGTLDALDAVDSAGRYISVDVRDVSALSDAIEEVRRDWGPVKGLVHGAGVIADRRIADKTDEQFEKVVGTKVAGFWALCSATAQDPIEVMCIFSSVAARAGNVGQADYAIANEILNKSAQIEARRREDCVVKSIGWGPWDGGMVGPELRRVFEERGIALIDREAGAAVFADELLGDSADVEIVVGSLIDTTETEAGDSPERAEQTDQPHTKSAPSGHSRSDTVFERAVKVSAESHPYLLDHVIDGTPVLPFVAAVEMFLDTCRAWFDPRDLALTDIRVKQGVKFGSRHDTQRLTIRARRTTNGIDRAALELFDPSGTLCYTATAVPRPEPSEPRIAAPEATDQTYDGIVYDGQLLFHGPSLRVLEDVYQPGETGMTATVLTSRGAGWESAHLDADPAALDAAMQLAVLWTSQRIKGLSLPLGVADFRALRPFDSDRVTAVLQERSSNKSRTLTDIDLVDDSGQLVATLRGVEVYKYR